MVTDARRATGAAVLVAALCLVPGAASASSGSKSRCHGDALALRSGGRWSCVALPARTESQALRTMAQTPLATLRVGGATLHVTFPKTDLPDIVAGLRATQARFDAAVGAHLPKPERPRPRSVHAAAVQVVASANEGPSGPGGTGPFVSGRTTLDEGGPQTTVDMTMEEGVANAVSDDGFSGTIAGVTERGFHARFDKCPDDRGRIDAELKGHDGMGVRMQGTIGDAAARVYSHFSVDHRATAVGHTSDAGKFASADLDDTISVAMGLGEVTDPATGKPIPGKGLTEPPRLYTFHFHENGVGAPGGSTRPTATLNHVSGGATGVERQRAIDLAYVSFSMFKDRVAGALRKGSAYYYFGPCLKLKGSGTPATLKPGGRARIKLAVTGTEKGRDIPIEAKAYDDGTVAPKHARADVGKTASFTFHASRHRPDNGTYRVFFTTASKHGAAIASVELPTARTLHIAAVDVHVTATASSLPDADGYGALTTMFSVQRDETIRHTFGPDDTKTDRMGPASLLSVPGFARDVQQTGKASTRYQGQMQELDCARHESSKQPFSLMVTPQHGGGARIGLTGLLPSSPSLQCFEMGKEPYVSEPIPTPPGGLQVTLSAQRMSGAKIVIPIDVSASGRASKFGSSGQDANVSATWKGTVTLAR